MSVYTEEVNLKDGISGPAKSASNELNALTKALTSAQDKLTVASATGNIKAFKAAQADVSALKAAISQLPPASSAATAATNELANATTQATGSSMGLQEELAELTGGLSIVVEVAGAVVAAFGAVVVAGAAMAIKASEAKQKMTSLFDALGEGKISGKETIGMLDELGDQIGQTREKLAPLAKEFVTMGVTSTAQLKSLTLAAASAGAMAEGGAEAFTKLYKQASAAAETGSKFTVPYKKLDAQLAAMGLNIGDLAKAMGKSPEDLTRGLKAGTINAKEFANALQQAATTKGAGPLARAGASLTNVWAKFQENISKFFEDVDVGPFLEQVKGLFDIFGQAQPSGQALKAGIGGFFKQVFETATKVVPLVRHFLLDLVIYGLKAYIALKPIVKWFKDLQQNQAVMRVVTTLFEGLKVAAIAVGVVIGVVVVSFGVLAATMVTVTVAFWGLVGTIGAFVSNTIGALIGWAGGAAKAAKDFIAGLVNGIAGGASSVVKAVKGLADGAKNAFKNALGIHSPSKEMMKLGNFAGQGVAMGLDQSADQVGASSASMAGSAKDGAASGLSGGGSGGGGGATTINVTVESGAIVIGGGAAGGQSGGGQSAAELTETAVALIFERIALASGL